MTVSRHKGTDRARALEAPCIIGRVLWLLIPYFLWILIPTSAIAESGNTAEYRVKLAFLYNFAQFIEWPETTFSSSTSPFTLCVLGPDPFEGEIGQALQGRKAAGHPVQLVHLKSTDDPKGCQIVFIRASEKAASRKILAPFRGSNILIVGESNGFADSSGVINLMLIENKMRFEINMDAARQTQLKISSKLLALAKIVRAEKSP